MSDHADYFVVKQKLQIHDSPNGTKHFPQIRRRQTKGKSNSY